MTIRAIIFDLGGVLLRTADFSLREKLASKYGLSRAELEELIFYGYSGGGVQRGEISLEEHWKNVGLRLNCSPEELEKLIREFFAEDRLDNDLLNYIRQLHEKYKTALLSNAASNLRTQIAEKWHFEDAFDVMVISGEIGMLKPEVGIFVHVVEQLCVEAGEAVFVDDARENVEGARKAGLSAIHFHSPQQARAELERLLTAG